MSEKKARQIRKFIGVTKEKPQYTEGFPSIWGPLPINKVSKKVDHKRLRKLLSENKNPKFKTVQEKNRFGKLIPENLFRYSIGVPISLTYNSIRKQYQLYKRNYCVVA